MSAVDFFAGVPVSDYAAALEWYEHFLGQPPSFVPDPTEAVWDISEHTYVYIDVRPEHAGHAMHTLFVDDLDERVASIAERGIDPVERETYENGIRKVIFHDPDGNEISLGGGPVD